MAVLDQARALANELIRSNELKALKQAEQQVMADQNAYNMVRKYMEMEQSLAVKQMQGQVPEADTKNLNSYREQISKNATVANFFKAKYNFDQLWYQVNQIIGTVMQ